MDLSNERFFNWIIPESMIAQINEELQDSFIVYGQRYLDIRNSLRDAFFLGQFKKLIFEKKKTKQIQRFSILWQYLKK